MKGCELCKSQARIYCESDQASLCWSCDAKVHSANFLVARHSRSVLCHVCQSLTAWSASGEKLGRTVSVCESCVVGSHGMKDGRGELEEESETDNDEEDEEDDDDQEEDEEEVDLDDEDGDNQVVPWSSTSPPPPESSSTSGDSTIIFSNGDRDVSSKITHDNDDLGCSSSSFQWDNQTPTRVQSNEGVEEAFVDTSLSLRPWKTRKIESIKNPTVFSSPESP